MRLATEQGTKPDGLQCEIVVYRLNVSKPEEKAAYDALCQECEAQGSKLMRVYAMEKGYKLGPSRTVTLETKHLFGDQWNTAPDEHSELGFRVHNWYEEIVPNANIRIGHYLKITQEMRDVCAATFKCGYCGAEYYGAHNEGAFCSKCLDSAYLQEKDLHLLRLLPVNILGSHKDSRAPLTEDERAWIMPLYVARQTTGTDSRNAQRLAKQRKDLLHDYEVTVTHEKTKRDGMLWLMDHGISIDNVIYYSHTGRFGFGWRTPLSEQVASALLDLLCEFPFDYDIVKAKVS